MGFYINLIQLRIKSRYMVIFEALQRWAENHAELSDFRAWMSNVHHVYKLQLAFDISVCVSKMQ